MYSNSTKEPEGDWTRWVISGPRQSGRSTLLAKFVVSRAELHPGSKIAVVCSTYSQTKYFQEKIAGNTSEVLSYSIIHHSLTWINGSAVLFFSAQNPDSIRGHQFHYAACDDVDNWPFPPVELEDELVPLTSWENVSYATRLGTLSQIALTYFDD